MDNIVNQIVQELGINNKIKHAVLYISKGGISDRRSEEDCTPILLIKNANTKTSIYTINLNTGKPTKSSKNQTILSENIIIQIKNLVY